MAILTLADTHGRAPAVERPTRTVRRRVLALLLAAGAGAAAAVATALALGSALTLQLPLG